MSPSSDRSAATATRRSLVTCIESVDRSDLSALSQLLSLTRPWIGSLGFDTSQWPSTAQFLDWFNDPGSDTRVLQRWTDDGQPQRFLLTSYEDHDTLIGVSSRRKKDKRGERSENVATNLLLDLLACPTGRGPGPYSELFSFFDDRLWRTAVGGTFLVQEASEWQTTLSFPNFSVRPGDDASALVGNLRSSMAAASSERLIRGGSEHRSAAHHDLRAKFARGKTHPVVTIDSKTKTMSYDLEVVDALREAARLRIAGWSWEECATKVGPRIPAYALRARPDTHPHRMTTRETFNRDRRERGLAELEFKFLADGETPNVKYKPETVADNMDPASALRKLFAGPTAPRGLEPSTRIGASQIAIGDAYLEFLTTGIYRRLVKDFSRSNSRNTEYMWVEADLGKADSGYVLDAGTAQQLRELGSNRTARTASTELPLAGLFDIAIDEPLLTRQGWIGPEDGRIVWRTSHNETGAAYRVYFEPRGAAPHGADCRILGYVNAAEINQALVEAITAALEGSADEFEVTPPPQASEEAIQVRDCEAAVQAATEEFDDAVDALRDKSLSERQRARLRTSADEAEATLELAERELRAARDSLSIEGAARDAEAPIGKLVDVLAALSSGAQLEKSLARAVGRTLRTVLRRPRLRFDPAHGCLRFAATLELETLDGAALRVPIDGQVANHSVDTWVAGLGGRFLYRRRPVMQLWEELGLTTDYEASGHWRRQISDGLLNLELGFTRKLAGPTAAGLLVRCPNTKIIETAFNIMEGRPSAPEEAELRREVEKLLFVSDPTGQPDWGGRLCRSATDIVKALSHPAEGDD